MKQQGQRRNNSNNRNRARRGGGGGGNNMRMQSYDSNGPDVRIRGTAMQIYDKYCNLAKDAASAGDRIMAENYLQHAEHYQRIVNFHAQNAATANQRNNNNKNERDNNSDNSDSGNDIDEKLVDTVDDLEDNADKKAADKNEVEEDSIDAAFLKKPVRVAKAAQAD